MQRNRKQQLGLLSCGSSLRTALKLLGQQPPLKGSACVQSAPKLVLDDEPVQRRFIVEQGLTGIEFRALNNAAPASATQKQPVGKRQAVLVTG
ncbi:MAG: hypothetical protein CMQ14_04095 [Gammaproteobacteria bacterium]|nr:hypothetical protein [Gammaproteobacteria bacterium]